MSEDSLQSSVKGSDLNSANMEQASGEDSHECCSIMEYSENPESTTILVERECAEEQHRSSIVMGRQGDLQPSMEKQDMEKCCISSLTEMDCPVCFCKFDIYRVPKLLSCKHTFCAVCLKLLVRHEDGTWLIGCPICRATTVVFGGLICTLQNQELLMSRLEKPECKSPSPLHGNLSPNIDTEESDGNLKMAAKRLVALLMILLILLVIILQFVYTGIMKWVLGFILGVVVIVTVLLCFNPNCRINLSRPSATMQKDNYIVSAV